MIFYNFRRPHQAMNNQMPMAVWRAGIDRIEVAARPVDMPLRLDNANALPTYQRGMDSGPARQTRARTSSRNRFIVVSISSALDLGRHALLAETHPSRNRDIAPGYRWG